MLSSQTILKIENISKSFGETKVIEDLSFEIAAGEFITILGSSGCGKTTLLRMISGLEEADSGKILLDGKDVTHAEPNHREVNTVFQHYALFPHMTVCDNIAYPLKIARVPKEEIKKRVSDALKLVQMQGLEKRYPASLSGGQKQRIAIARAIVARPKILLLDEPLGALDLNLRHAMQTELKKLQETLGITFLYITHDQEEALNMSDRIAVMKDGRFLQIGAPAEVYDSPKNVYVACFMGEANIVSCVYEREENDAFAVKFGGNQLLLRKNGVKYEKGDTVRAAIRGEKITVQTEGADGIEAVITDLNFAGGIMKITAETNGERITAVRYGLDTALSVGQRVRLAIPALAGIAVEE